MPSKRDRLRVSKIPFPLACISQKARDLCRRRNFSLASDFLCMVDLVERDQTVGRFGIMAPLKAATLLLAATSQLVSCSWIPRPLDETNILTRREEVAAEYDYVIVGGGTSGLTVGDRLSENGKCMEGERKRHTMPPPRATFPKMKYANRT